MTKIFDQVKRMTPFPKLPLAFQTYYNVDCDLERFGSDSKYREQVQLDVTLKLLSSIDWEKITTVPKLVDISEVISECTGYKEHLVFKETLQFIQGDLKCQVLKMI